MTLSEKLNALSADQKATFLELLSHELTISIRTIWSDEEISPDEKVDRIKWINEIHHRVPLRVLALKREDEDWTGDYLGLDIDHWCNQNEAIRPLVTYALKSSIKKTENK
jgi:hypothetical protein